MRAVPQILELGLPIDGRAERQLGSLSEGFMNLFDLDDKVTAAAVAAAGTVSPP